MTNPQLDLFGTSDHRNTDDLELTWPDQRRFPLNRTAQRVADLVFADLCRGDAPLIVTGYASLDQILDFLGRFTQQDEPKVLRLVLGAEPFESRARSHHQANLPVDDEIRAYWLEKGISLHHSAKIVMAIDMVQSARLQCRKAGDHHRKLHAKIYSSSEAVTLGSSNFTRNGLHWQLESNARFSASNEKRRYREAKEIAENLWSMGQDYGKQLVSLLSDLLKVVTWQEALARACAELLEGHWARLYIEHAQALGEPRLWPSQRQGIAQALWILENVGSVLVADPTGSGKTRMGSHLLRALSDQAWSRGRIHAFGSRDLSVLICPPGVAPNWQKEATQCGLSLQIRSHGMLSNAIFEGHDNAVAMIRRAQVLSVDEAHNYLNPGSNRARQIMGNLAEHVVLFTATPINKGASDLVSLVEMLGADNMGEETLRVLEGLSRRRKVSDSTMSRAEINRLRQEIQRFTVRRTKSLLNLMVDQSPDAYLDHHGKRCRYPEHASQVYSTGESAADRALALQIRRLAQQLKGLALLEHQIELPESLRKDDWSEQSYLAGRLLAVRSLSAYNIMACLRSSKAALYEHLLGTQHVMGLLGIGASVKKAVTGNLIQKLRKKSAGPLPLVKLACPLPTWLSDKVAFEQACHDEIALMQEIVICLDQISPAREAAKARLLNELSRSHSLILAFDSHLISLEVIRMKLQELSPDQTVSIASGSHSEGKKVVIQQFARDARGQGIALCSDSMSEGLNLQGASAIVHLNMPSVVRIAEQRVGRVDRMDSPHTVVQAWWPADSEEFSLRADERFLERYQTVETLLGANMPLPAEFGAIDPGQTVTAQCMIHEAGMSEADPWDGIRDAFSPVRDLVQGSKAIVSQDIYQLYRETRTRLLARVSLVKARKAWAFFCVRGVHEGPPKWVLMIDGVPRPYVALDEVCLRLRPLLEAGVENLPMTQQATQVLDRFLWQLARLEVQLLSRRKQRALSQMQTVLTHYRNVALQQADTAAARRWEILLSAAQRQSSNSESDQDRDLTPVLDLEMLADQWLILIRPYWHSMLGRRKRRRAPLTLKDLNKDLLATPLLLETVEQSVSSIPVAQPVDRRIAACIVGLA